MVDLWIPESAGAALAAKKAWLALETGAAERDIDLAIASGFDPRDVHTIRDYSEAKSLLLVFRCPKASARPWHGEYKPKVGAVAAKSDASGRAAQGGRIYVSDYDLMSVWRVSGTLAARGYQKIFVTALQRGAKRGAWSTEARDTVRGLNSSGMVSRVQHGAQDDWASAGNRGVDPTDRFLAFEAGQAWYLASTAECERFYRARGLRWPYAADGSYTGPSELYGATGKPIGGDWTQKGGAPNTGVVLLDGYGRPIDI
jgi:hypothetical protein